MKPNIIPIARLLGVILFVAIYGVEFVGTLGFCGLSSASTSGPWLSFASGRVSILTRFGGLVLAGGQGSEGLRSRAG